MEIVSELWDSFERLTAPQKRVVFEMYWNGYTEEETAETMGIARVTVSRTLKAAKAAIEKRLSPVIQKTELVSVLSVDKAEEQRTPRGNGHPPDKTKPPVRSGPPASACPPPDIYLGSPARDAFIKELSWIAASPFLQLQGRGGYVERARMNRERIARDRERERAERMAAVAA